MSHWYGNFNSNPVEYFQNFYKENDSIVESWGCFGAMGSFYRHDKDFFIGLVIEPDIIERYAIDFKKHFNNMEIVPAGSIDLYQIHDAFYGYKWTLDPVEDAKYGHISFWTMKFNDGYNKLVKMAMYPFFGELIRLFSKEYYAYDGDIEYLETVKQIEHYRGNLDFVEFSWDFDQDIADPDIASYNAIRYKTPISNFYKLDDIDFMNRAFNKDRNLDKNSRYYSNAVAIDQSPRLIYPTLTMDLIRQQIREDKK